MAGVERWWGVCGWSEEVKQIFGHDDGSSW
jgi:hypothetical protein